MKVVIFLIVVFLVGCGEFQPLPLINYDAGEYFYLKPDCNVRGPNWMSVGYSLRSSKDGRVLCTFQRQPKEVHIEDFNGDGLKDIVYIVPDTGVKSRNTCRPYGYSMKVVLKNADGSFQQPRVISTFDYDSIN